jgi:hypothetical protein
MSHSLVRVLLDGPGEPGTGLVWMFFLAMKRVKRPAKDARKKTELIYFLTDFHLLNYSQCQMIDTEGEQGGGHSWPA